MSAKCMLECIAVQGDYNAGLLLPVTDKSHNACFFHSVVVDDVISISSLRTPSPHPAGSAAWPVRHSCLHSCRTLVTGHPRIPPGAFGARVGSLGGAAAR